ncbi:MAG: energy transducer TonB, partial [Terriglobales bacterium]
ESHIALLQKLAVLAEHARSALPESASPAVPHLPSEIESTRTSGALPASHRVRNAGFATWGGRLRPVVLGALGLVVIALLAVAIWRGWRGPQRANRETYTAPISASPADANRASVRSTTPNTASPGAAIDHPDGTDTKGMANPGSQSVSPSYEQLSIGAPVKLASKLDAVAGTKTQARNPVHRSLSTGDVAPNVVIRYGPSGSQIGSKTGLKSESKTGAPPDSRSDFHSDAASSAVPPSIPAGSATSSPINEVFSARISLPQLSTPVSQGVSGGQLVHRVQPLYPAQARALHLEGKVVLAALIAEDGKLRDVKVVTGQPLLAQSAVEAVKRWRYKPYELDGKPVKNEIRINIEFKFPELDQ